MEVRVVVQADVEAWPAGQPNEQLGYVARVVRTPGGLAGVDKVALTLWVKSELLGIFDKIEEVLTCGDQTGG